jgi:membrane-bound serine protease (ClpP class)
MPLQYELLQLLVNPNVAYLLILAGVIGIAIELFSPGLILPGALGVVSFVLGLYGSAQLPVTAAGVALLVLGIGLIVAEAHLATSGILGIVGVISLAASGLLLFEDDGEGFGISPPLVIGVALTLGGLLVVATKKVVEARRRPVLTGSEELTGQVGDVRVALDPVGQVFVAGALWRARATRRDREGPIRAGDRVRVESVEGLTLRVSPIAGGSDQPAQGGSA